MAIQIRQLIIVADREGRIWIDDKLPSFLDYDADNLIILNGLNTILINLDKIQHITPPIILDSTIFYSDNKIHRL